jgi:hypothetical protein
LHGFNSAHFSCQKPAIALAGEIIEDGSGLNDFRKRFRRHLIA